jgi:hypothetical protein
MGPAGVFVVNMPGKGGFLRLQAIEARKWFQAARGGLLASKA